MNKINLQLEDEAIEEWDKMPADKRFKKVGLFRKEEDLAKRDAFIRRHKQLNFEKRLNEEQSTSS